MKFKVGRMKFKVGDVVSNVYTDEISIVTKVEREWALPVYEIESIDGDRTDRFNVRYEHCWEVVFDKETADFLRGRKAEGEEE